ncbi:jg22725, partial [Pararge aegeria aegeria]
MDATTKKAEKKIQKRRMDALEDLQKIG